MATKKKKILSKNEQIQSAMDRVRDLRYSLNYDYRKDCSYCDDDDYHRNCRIVDFELNPINVERCLDVLLKNVDDPFIQYGVERIFHIQGLYSTENWDKTISQGYYGEEVDDVFPVDKSKFLEMVNALKGMTDREIVLKCLEYEYGYVLPAIMPLNFDIRDIDLADVEFPNDRYVVKVKGEPEFYRDWKYPLGIVTEKGSRYSVVDGYHRLTTAIVQGKNVASVQVKVIVGS